MRGGQWAKYWSHFYKTNSLHGRDRQITKGIHKHTIGRQQCRRSHTLKEMHPPPKLCATMDLPKKRNAIISLSLVKWVNISGVKL